MATYLLKCSCGASVPVEVGQAGELVDCPACAARLEAPTLRKLRHLPVAERLAERRTRDWGPRQGVTAAATILAAVLVGIAGWSRWSEPAVPQFDPSARMHRVDEGLDKLSPVESWHMWVELYRPMAKRGLAVIEDPYKPAIEQYIAKQRFVQKSLLFATAICIAVALAAALWPRRAPGRKP
ncbi:MAG: hypothetical protein WD738_19175 [Pirellulales bacterium]